MKDIITELEIALQHCLYVCSVHLMALNPSLSGPYSPTRYSTILGTRKLLSVLIKVHYSDQPDLSQARL
jgi:hypothetical protein